MLKDTRMTSFLILHQMANEKMCYTGERYELWLRDIIYICDDTEKSCLLHSACFLQLCDLGHRGENETTQASKQHTAKGIRTHRIGTCGA